MDVESKLELCLKPPVEEVVTREELKELLETNSKPRHYIGFEASGLLHAGSLACSNVVNNLSKAGFDTQIFVADWHTLANSKFGGDFDKIQTAVRYFEEAFKFLCPKAEIVRGTDLYSKHYDEYWKSVIRFSTHVTLARATRTMQVLGRSESDTLDVAKYIYPSMQGVDIKFLKADVAHAGMDQRKVHMLAREVFPKMGWKPPIALHHSLLPALSGEDLKMSKSKPDTAILLHDSEAEVKRKISKAFCPEKTVEGNPLLSYAQNLIFAGKGMMLVERPAKFGGNVEFLSFDELKNSFAKGELHPTDLKNAVASELNALMEPMRKHFESGKTKDLVEQVKSLQSK